MRNSFWVPRAVTLVLLSASLTPDVAFGRMRWLERDGRAISLYPRRFGQEHPAAIEQLSAACPNGVGTCASLAGAFISTLLVNSPECAQQDAADGIIDASKQFDSATQVKMIALAQVLRKSEKNSSPDFSVQPNINRNTVFCQKCPRNPELNGLVQAQDPANNKTAFFDPASPQKTVILGTQANTEPFKGPCPNSATNTSATTSNSTTTNTSATTSNSTTTHSSAAKKTTTTTNSSDAIHKTTTTNSTSVCKTSNTTSASPSNSSAVANLSASSANFGSCSTPEIKFAAALDGRKETAFEPNDLKSYNHGSAQNIGIISQFMCDTLTNTCKANQAAKDLCAQAETAANSATPPKTGIQADVFNKAFGITTNFQAVQALDDKGQPLNSGSTPSNSSANSTNTAVSSPSFGSCSTPQIKFAAGLDGRKETAFESVDLKSYNHGSAQNIGIISQFMCDTLTNTCKANQAAKDLCAQAETAANAATPPKTGIQADVFNKAFGITTNFQAVQALDDQGQPLNSGSTPSNSSANPTNTAVSNPSFGSCSTPQIKFAAGLDGRKETAFAPVDQNSYNHGSADNIAVITSFMCLALTNSCKANQAAKDLCAQAQTAASAATPALSGSQADAFNKVLGLNTDFAAVTPIDNTGNPVKNQ